MSNPSESPISALGTKGYYAGRTAALATMHGKQDAIAPVLEAHLGLSVVVPDRLDTDALGTFTGEIERPGDMLETAIAKARLGMQAAGTNIGIASEGSYGPHPVMPFVPLGRELIVLIDDTRGITIKEVLLCDATNFLHVLASTIDDIENFLQRVGFPEHGLIVRPNRAAPGGARVLKGIQCLDSLSQAIRHLAESSSDRRARIEADMRAHQNPTRMAAIADASRLLADRVATLCPSCESPGFGREGSETGLPCSWCGAPTERVLHEIMGCAACDHTEEQSRSDGLTEADPGQCQYCNP